jgi:hypothetical protein
MDDPYHKDRGKGGVLRGVHLPQPSIFFFFFFIFLPMLHTLLRIGNAAQLPRSV